MSNLVNFDLYRLKKNIQAVAVAIENDNYDQAIKLLTENLTIIKRLKKNAKTEDLAIENDKAISSLSEILDRLNDKENRIPPN